MLTGASVVVGANELTVARAVVDGAVVLGAVVVGAVVDVLEAEADVVADGSASAVVVAGSDVAGSDVVDPDVDGSVVLTAGRVVLVTTPDSTASSVTKRPVRPA